MKVNVKSKAAGLETKIFELFLKNSGNFSVGLKLCWLAFSGQRPKGQPAGLYMAFLALKIC